MRACALHLTVLRARDDHTGGSKLAVDHRIAIDGKNIRMGHPGIASAQIGAAVVVESLIEPGRRVKVVEFRITLGVDTDERQDLLDLTHLKFRTDPGLLR